MTFLGNGELWFTDKPSVGGQGELQGDGGGIDRILCGECYCHCDTRTILSDEGTALPLEKVHMFIILEEEMH